MFGHHLVRVGFLADHCVVLVVAVVGIPAQYMYLQKDGKIYLPELAIRSELKLQKLVTELALVANVVAEVEIVRHLNEFTRALKRKARYFQFKRTAVQIEIKIFGQIVLFPSILVGALLCSCRAANVH